MEKIEQGASRGAGSFCIPRAAINALLDNAATAYEVATYLTLARFTDESGQFSTASAAAVNRYTRANKTRGGPIDRAITRLQSIRVKRSNGKKETDFGPILYSRDGWVRATGEILPTGPHQRAEILHILPHFDEAVEDRVWFGNNLVSGAGGFTQPLKALKNAGDVPARLLLALYAANDMETWGGIAPVGTVRGPWSRYETVSDDVSLSGVARLIRAKEAGKVGYAEKRIIHSEDTNIYFRALDALVSSGLVYEVVMVLNRNSTPSTFGNGDAYGAIPNDAEPLYELDCKSRHGYKPAGEGGMAWATARTAGDIGHSVAKPGGSFDGTYAAIVPAGFGAMICGIYRTRFRVTNRKNATVRGAWASIHQRNAEALHLINSVRAKNGLESLKPPKNDGGAE